MSSIEMTVTTKDGPMGVVLALPEGATRGGVVVLMEAFGVNDHVRDVCHRFSELGFVAIAPDLYHRIGRFITGDYADPSSIMAHFADLNTDDMASDTTGASSWLIAQTGIAAFGVVGFCLGGYGAVLAAIRNEPAVVAGFYGAGLSIRREGSPLDPLAPEFGAIRCPVHLFYGADDPVIPADEIRATEEGLAQAGVAHWVRVYPSAGHGFFCDARGSYRREAATDAWDRVVGAFTAAMPGIKS